MRGSDRQQCAMFSYVFPEERMPQDHPPRRIRQLTCEVLRELSPEFERLYAVAGRPRSHRRSCCGRCCCRCFTAFGVSGC